MTLPQGWVWARVDELAGVNGVVTDGDWVESKDQDATGDVRLTQLADIGEGEFQDRSRRYMNRETAERLRCTFLQPGDALIARMPDPIGRACLFPGLDQPAVTAVDVMVWRTDGTLACADWFVHWVNSPSVRAALAEGAGGTTRQRIAGGKIKELRLPIPPKAEQNRIVTVLDALIRSLRRAQAELDRVPPLAQRFKKQVLNDAFCGRTQSSRVPCDQWEMHSAADICDKVQSGGTPKAGFVDGGVPFLKVYNIVKQEVAFDYRPQYVTRQIHETELKKSIVRPGDVLMNIVGPPLGKVAIVPDTLGECNINQAITLFRPSKRFASEWIYYFLCSGQSVASVVDDTRGIAGQVNISLSQCRAFQVPIPPIEEQQRIIGDIEAAFARADRLEAEATRARALLDRLEAAILAKAFRGELVPQDPNDEPASVLLDRIRAERAAAPKPTRGRASKAVG